MILVFPFLLALILSLILVPIARNVSLRFGLVDIPKDDRWHTKPTPKVGGIAIFISFAVVVATTTLIAPTNDIQWALLAGSLITFLLGVLDDNKHLSPGAKIIGQILAATVVVFFGRNLQFFDLEILNIIFTFLWLIGITNAINLLDNMDGLAGGVALIAAFMLSLMFWQVEAVDLLAISLALGGSILGFLVFNFPPASIFMGDGGSLFLGFTLASLAIAQVPRASNLLAILGVPTLIFLLPILDTTMVTITRILRGQSPTQGGKDHTSHRLIAFGLSERQTVLVLYGVALLSGIIGSFLESIDYNVSILLIPILLLVFTLLTAYLARIKVVETSKTHHTPGSITRLVIGITGRGRVLEIALDLVIICLSYYLAFWLYFGNGINILSMGEFLQSLPIAIAGSYIAFFIFGIYRRIWPYVGVKDLFRFILAAIGSGLFLLSVQNFIFPESQISISIIFLFSMFLFLGLAASRASFRLLDQLYSPQIKDDGNHTSVLIFGADDIGLLTLQWLLHNPETKYHAIGFLDDDPFKRGRQIQGIDILGSFDDLETIIEKHEIQGIILPANATIEYFQQSTAMKICEQRGIWFKRLRIDFESIK
jgi:UDP-GlcNAc:undecaprenyl-phosphate GlcNAc-1-phosphate transferase